jgi:hypothetical protein
MNAIFLIADLILAMIFCTMAYTVGTAIIYTPDPRWSAEQYQANRRTLKACYAMMALAALCGLTIVPMAILIVPFWDGPWWGRADAVVTILLGIAWVLVRRPVRDIRAQRYRVLG